MSLIQTTPPEKAEGKLAELYEGAEQFFGAVPNNVRMLGVSPAVLENQFHFAQYYMNHPTLSAPLLATLRMLVAKASKSAYCEQLNAGMLVRHGLAAKQVEAAKADPGQAPLSEKEKALLLFVLRAVSDPHAISVGDMEGLRAMGWADVDIFDAVAHGARAVATNIIFDTFKIDRD